uniref:Chemokine interleukin-8-like domain-containing protein n=1 Tax=Paramormyrops kingsleyae TaxID=1676925 RepID=A0A3B3T480_9TELE
MFHIPKIRGFVIRSYLLKVKCLFSVVYPLFYGDEKVTSCCTTVSRRKITSPILGYRTQKWSPPCVKAVIFETEDGPVCSHWREEWVFQKVKELDALAVMLGQ